MKRTAILLIVLAAIFFTSCKKECYDLYKMEITSRYDEEGNYVRDTTYYAITSRCEEPEYIIIDTIDNTSPIGGPIKIGI